MAENRQPVLDADLQRMSHINATPMQPPPRIDLSTTMKRAHLSRSAKKKPSTSRVIEPKPMPALFSNVTNASRRDDQEGEGERMEQERARMQLISPPPEEMLRKPQRNIQSTPFTPSLLASPPDDPQDNTHTNAKRKRQVHTPKLTRTALPPPSPEEEEALLANHPRRGRAASTSHGDPSTSTLPSTSTGAWAEATPNPRLRKQPRTTPTHENGDDHHHHDVRMESPTRPQRVLGVDKGKGRESRGSTTREMLMSPQVDLEPREYQPPVSVQLFPGTSPVQKTKGRGRRVGEDGLGEEVVSPPARDRMKGKTKARPRASTSPMRPPTPGDDPLLLSHDDDHAGAFDFEGIVGTPGPRWIQSGTPKKRGQPVKPRTVERKDLTTATMSARRKRVRTPGSAGKKTVVLESTSTAEAASVVLEEELLEELGVELGVGLGQRLEEARKTPPRRGPFDFDLPPSSSPRSEHDEEEASSEGNFDWTGHTVPMESSEDSMIQMDPADAQVTPVGVGMFDFDAALRAHAEEERREAAAANARLKTQGQSQAKDQEGWSDSDDELDSLGDVEGRGEYTGRYRMLKVRTKADPPSEATMMRMEEWGRPVSPFPGVRRLRLDGDGEEEVEVELEKEDDGAGLGLEQEGAPEPQQEEEEEIDELPTITTSEADALERENEEQQYRQEYPDEDEEEEEEVVRMSLEPDEDVPVHPDAPATPAQPQSPRNSGEGGESHLSSSLSRSFARRVALQDSSTPLPMSAAGRRESMRLRAQAIFDFGEVPEEQSPAQEEGVVEGEPQEEEEEEEEMDEPFTPQPKRKEEPVYEEHFTPVKKGHHEETTDDDQEEDVEVEEEEEPEVEAEEEQGGDDMSDLEDMDLGMVKIVSADPRAAARAAAILKQYDYECFTKTSMKKEREKRRYSSLDDFSQDARRRSLLGSGVSKAAARNAAEKDRRRRRSTLGMGVIGEKVIIPGSPIVTMPELLEKVEKEVLQEVVGPMSPARVGALRSPVGNRSFDTPVQSGDVRNPFETPVPGVGRVEVPAAIAAWNAVPVPQIVVDSQEEPSQEEEDEWEDEVQVEVKPWTKEEWKILDSCLTDERMGEGHGGYSPYTQELKEVDEVSLDAVVDRFVEMMGGREVIEQCGESWSRDMLKKRVVALQKKQRAGKIAPPTTPSAATPLLSPLKRTFGGKNRRASMEVPDFTPLGRRARPPARSRRTSPASQAGSESSSSSAENRRQSALPATLLAPRYSHLMEEAREISAEVRNLSLQLSSAQGVAEEGNSLAFPSFEGQSLAEQSQDSSVVAETPQPRDNADSKFKTPATSAGFGKKLKGIFFSYMPTLSKTAPQPRRQPREAHPGLPLPPPEILNKNRGPVTTPARPPIPKPPHPKELVELHPAPAPKQSKIPRLKTQAPKRFVELKHVSPRPEHAPGEPPRPRRSSGSSVKDLVKGFEEIRKVEEERSHSSLGSRPGSRAGVNEGRVFSGAGTLMSLSRPGWRP